MTKEQILKTLDTKVSDGTVTEILREIVNSIPAGNGPLIVEGDVQEEFGSLVFTPSGSITFTEAKEAFESGRNVILEVPSTDISEKSFIKITALAKRPHNNYYLSGDFVWIDDQEDIGTRHVFLDYILSQ